MYLTKGSIVCILTVLVAVQQATAQQTGLTDNNSSLCNECAPGQYLSIPLNVDTDCWNICIEDGLVGSGSAPSSVEVAGECIDCHNSCLSCYGPANNQCYSCRSFYITLPSYSNNSNLLACDNGTIRNTSLHVKRCVSNCTSPFILVASGSDNNNMECACPRGYYPSVDGSTCLQCNENCSVCVDGTQTGCLQCSVIMYDGQCLGECPAGLINVNGNCKMPIQNDLFPIDRTALFAIIGAIGFVILFSSFWIFCIIVFCLMRQKRKSKYLVATDHGGTTISESFKKVKRNISIKKRPSRPTSTVVINNEHVQERREIVSSEYDPYLKLNPAAITIDESRNEVHHRTTSAMELQTDPHDNHHDSDDEQEDQFYTDMTISATNLIPENGRPQQTHKPLGLTKSYEPPIRSNEAERRHRLSLPPQSPSHHIETEEQEIYIDPHEDPDENTSQENYMEMELGQVYEQDEYITSAEANSHFQDDEQELYTEMNIAIPSGPVVPKRAVVPPAASPATRSSNKQPTARKETLDNQYVTVTGHDAKLKSYLSDEKLGQAPKYVNIQRPGDPRLRSVTSPLQSGGPQKPSLHNAAEEDESFYGNVP